MIYQILLEAKRNRKKLVAVLIDPEKSETQKLIVFLELVNRSSVDFIFVGGSIVSKPIDSIVKIIKDNSKKPVILFPGNIMQISDNADAILLLSLISGRNPEFLIGQHVQAAPYLKKIGVETIPTGYVLIESGSTTSVEYMSNTRALPSNKSELIVATAIAGEMLGLKAIYLEGGSGADEPINKKIIKAVAESISVPLIVGGGIDSPEVLHTAFNAGADLVVMGTVFEKNPEKLALF